MSKLKEQAVHPTAILFLLFVLNIQVFAQANDSLKNERDRTKMIKILPVPTIGYEPETKTYVGLVSLITLDFYSNNLTRTSNAKLEFTYTFRNQVILETGWNYFFNEEEWFTSG